MAQLWLQESPGPAEPSEGDRQYLSREESCHGACDLRKEAREESPERGKAKLT